jgi:hypothetical protein
MLQLRAQPEYRRTRPLYPGFLGVASQAKIPINGSIILLISPLFLRCATEGSSDRVPSSYENSASTAPVSKKEPHRCRARLVSDQRMPSPNIATSSAKCGLARRVSAECAFTAAPAMW